MLGDDEISYRDHRALPCQARPALTSTIRAEAASLASQPEESVFSVARDL